MRWRTIAAIVALSVCAVVPLWAQPEPGEPQPPPEPPVDVPSEPVMPPPPPAELQPPVEQPRQQIRQPGQQAGSNVRQVLESIAERFKLQVVVDPLLQARVTPPAQANSAQAALDAVVKQIPGSAWRKVYLRADMELPASETLVNWVRTLVNLEAQGLIIADASSNRITSFVRNVTVSPDFEQQLGQMVPAFKTRPVYVVFYQQPMLAQTGQRAGQGQGQARAEDLLSAGATADAAIYADVSGGAATGDPHGRADVHEHGPVGADADDARRDAVVHEHVARRATDADTTGNADVPADVPRTASRSATGTRTIKIGKARLRLP
jgi:hypothetical protein